MENQPSHPGAMTMTPFATVNHLVVARATAGNSMQLGKRLLGLVECARQRKGCLNFTVKQSLTEPDLWQICGCWSNEASMNEWVNSPDLQVFSDLVQTTILLSMDFHTFASRVDQDIEIDRLIYAGGSLPV
jgi:quinol monooxygenase YgiN